MPVSRRTPHAKLLKLLRYAMLNRSLSNLSAQSGGGRKFRGLPPQKEDDGSATPSSVRSQVAMGLSGSQRAPYSHLLPLNPGSVAENAGGDDTAWYPKVVERDVEIIAIPPELQFRFNRATCRLRFDGARAVTAHVAYVRPGPRGLSEYSHPVAWRSESKLAKPQSAPVGVSRARGAGAHARAHVCMCMHACVSMHVRMRVCAHVAAAKIGLAAKHVDTPVAVRPLLPIVQPIAAAPSLSRTPSARSFITESDVAASVALPPLR